MADDIKRKGGDPFTPTPEANERLLEQAALENKALREKDAARDEQLAELQAELARLKARPVPEFAPAQDASTEVYAGPGPDGDSLWHYRIDLAPNGGTDIKINGVPFYQGQTYKVTTDTLRVLKDTVARGWVHEQQIHGSNENFYRKPLNRTISGKQ